MLSDQLIWGLSRLVRYALIALVVVSAFSFAEDVGAAPPNNRPPSNRPPDKGHGNGSQSNDIVVGTSSRSSASITSGDTVLEGGTQTVNVEFPEGTGDQITSSTNTMDGGDISINDGDSPVSIDTGRNVSNNESNFFALSTTFPNGHGCFGGAQGGGGGNGGGGWLGFHFLNWACFSNYLSEQQESVKVRARLDCSSKDFRKAIAFDQKWKARHLYCVTFMETEYTRQIEFERAQVEAALAAGQIEVMEDTYDPK